MSAIVRVRKSNPNIILSTDIIVGFPNETQEEYEDTLKLLDKAQFDFIYSYVYSARKGTKSAKMSDTLTDDVRGERLRYLQSYQLKIQEKLRAPLTGKTLRVLVDGQSNQKGIKKWKGRTNGNRIVHFEPTEVDKNYLWHWVDLEITSATALSCQGKLLMDHGKRVVSEKPINT